jgi:hypothetical protein
VLCRWQQGVQCDQLLEVVLRAGHRYKWQQLHNLRVHFVLRLIDLQTESKISLVNDITVHKKQEVNGGTREDYTLHQFVYFTDLVLFRVYN